MQINITMGELQQIVQAAGAHPDVMNSTMLRICVTPNREIHVWGTEQIARLKPRQLTPGQLDAIIEGTEHA